MKKPTKKTRSYYDWNECQDYIENKHKCSIRDFNGKFKKIKGKLHCNEEVEYLDFWHWICDNNEIHNGCFITLTKEEYKNIKEEWVKTIYGWFLEFADENEVEFYCWW